MIARLRGEVTEKVAQKLIIDVQGVGYEVNVADDRLYTLKDIVWLHIYSHWNQENGPQLFGFNDTLSKTVFAHILGCSGCGPKIGLAILSHFSASTFLRSVAVADVKALSQVSGVGTKKAELLIMHLKDKVTKMMALDSGTHEHASLSKVKNVHEALTALRYKPSEIALALDYLNKEASLETSPIEELLKKGLSFLAKRV